MAREADGSIVIDTLIRTETSEFKKMNTEIEKTAKKLDAVIEREIKAKTIGANTESKSFKGMEYDIDYLNAKLEELKAKKQQMIDSGEAYRFIPDTEVPKTDEKANRITESLQKIKAALSGVAPAFGKAQKAESKFSRSMARGAKRIATLLFGVSALRGLLIKLRAALVGGFRNLAQYSDETNQNISQLRSGLTQVKNSFATAFQPLLQSVMPAVNGFVQGLANAVTNFGMLVAALAGQKTFVKAIAVQEDYAASLNNSAKAQKNLSGLDEVRTYSSGSSSYSTPASEMFETVEIGSGIFEQADRIKEKFLSTFGGIVSAWNGHKGEFITALADLKAAVFGFFGEIGARNAEWIQNTNWDPLFLAVISFLQSLPGFITTVGNVLSDFNSSILQPIGTWLIEKALPFMIGLLGDIFAWLGENQWAVELLGAALIAALITPGIIGVINGVKGALTGLKTIVPLISGLFAGGGGLALAIAAVVAGIVLLIMHWDEVKIVMQKFGQWLNKVFAHDFTEDLGIFGHGLNALFHSISDIVAGIKRAFGGLFDFLGGLLSGDWPRMWQGAVDFFGGIWDTLAALARVPLNQVIALVNGCAEAVVAGLNAVIGGLNKISVKVPDWIPGIGGKNFGFNIGKITPPRIPYLASGAVIPANRPFTAMLGDQRHGNNLEAPEALIRKIVREESGIGQYRFTAQINRRVLFDEIIEEAKVRQTNSGRNPFEMA